MNVNKIKQAQKPSFVEFLKRRDAYNALPGRIDNEGKMKILFNGEWISKEELDSFFPCPVMPDFRGCLENCDRTKIWMYQ